MFGHQSTASSYRITSIEKAIRIIGLLSENHDGNNTLQQIASCSELSRNKAFRILSTLAELEIVEKNEQSGSYQLGVGAFELAQKLLRSSTVVNQAHSIIEQLAGRHQEAVYLSVLQGRDVLFLDMADCDQQIKTVPLVGRRYPVLSTAAGKVMAAMMASTEHITRWLEKGKKVPKDTEITSIETELAAIRQTGVAVDENAVAEGVISVSVPFKDYAGRVLGAITLLGPSFRLLAHRLESEIIPSLQEGAEALSMKFGYAPM